MKRIALALAILVIAAPAFAQEQVGCDKFKWPLDRERALLTQAKPAKFADDIAIGSAVKLALMPAAEVKLPVPTTRAPKEGSFAGILNGSALGAPGTYRVTLSANAWVEIIQDGQLVKSGEFSGVGGCEGLRKSVKFTLTAKPFIIELTGVATPDIGVAVTPD